MENKSHAVLFALTAVAMLIGCTIDGRIEEINDEPLVPIKNSSRQNPDFISGEVVTSSFGYQAIGVFGEISEKKTSSNSYKMEGAFYE